MHLELWKLGHNVELLNLGRNIELWKLGCNIELVTNSNRISSSGSKELLKTFKASLYSPEKHFLFDNVTV